jgi:hypothetical protein
MKYLNGVFVAALLAATPVIAAPFNLDPDSFKYWLNATQQSGWGDGKRIYFEALSGCSYFELTNMYTCYSSYVRLTDPRGTRVCLAIVQWEGDSYKSDGSPRYGGGTSVRKVSDCRWLKDPRFADS